MRVFSATSFFCELDVLEIRLATLDPFVDIHVIGEATTTYSGHPKPLFFEQHKERFAPWMHKIRYVVIDDMPNGNKLTPVSGILQSSESDHWVRENHQRRSLIRGMGDLTDEDLVLLSDLDEIPSLDSFHMLKNAFKYYGARAIMCPVLAMHVYALNWRWSESLAVIARFFWGSQLKWFDDLEVIRKQPGTPYGSYRDPAGLGHHLAYMGGQEWISYKLRSAAHHEIDTPMFNNSDRILNSIRTGEDLFGRADRQASWVGLDKLPAYVAENQSKFSHMMVPDPATMVIA